MKLARALLLGAALIGMSIPEAGAAEAGATLSAVKQRGKVNCGVFGVIPGFSLPDSRGVMRGIDADACRAIAAAVFGDPEAVNWVMLTAQQRLPALQSGEVDVVYANLTWTFSREIESGLAYASIHYYDGQTFLVKKAINVNSMKELDGVSVCLTQGSTIEQSVQEYFAKNNMQFTPVVFADVSETRKAFLADRCDATAGDGSSLAGFKASLGTDSANYVILPERISNEPLGGAVRKGDGQWFDIVRWSHFALVNAEILGITKDNVDTFKGGGDSNIRRFLGEEGTLGAALGLSPDWAYAIIKGVGNFGEVWDRNVIGVERGLNRVWTQGGLQYAPPFR